MKDCNQCGKCCIKYGDGALSATADEIALWEIFNPEIYAYVKDDEIWFDPATGSKLKQCPFLEIISIEQDGVSRKYSCSIYLDRPEDCRHYPSLITEMIHDECEMIEAADMQNVKRSQQRLDNLMKASRRANYS